MYKFLVGTPDDGPFSETKAEKFTDAESCVEFNYGEILDVVDWTDDNGEPIKMFIVAK